MAQLNGLVSTHGADYGLLATWTGLSKPARDAVKHQRFRVKVWDSTDGGTNWAKVLDIVTATRTAGSTVTYTLTSVNQALPHLRRRDRDAAGAHHERRFGFGRRRCRLAHGLDELHRDDLRRGGAAPVRAAIGVHAEHEACQFDHGEGEGEDQPEPEHAPLADGSLPAQAALPRQRVAGQPQRTGRMQQDLVAGGRCCMGRSLAVGQVDTVVAKRRSLPGGR